MVGLTGSGYNEYPADYWNGEIGPRILATFIKWVMDLKTPYARGGVVTTPAGVSLLADRLALEGMELGARVIKGGWDD